MYAVFYQYLTVELHVSTRFHFRETHTAAPLYRMIDGATSGRSSIKCVFSVRSETARLIRTNE